MTEKEYNAWLSKKIEKALDSKKVSAQDAISFLGFDPENPFKSQ